MTKEQIRKEAISQIFDKIGLKDLGFKYLKSKNIFERKSNGLTYIIGFGSTRNNSLENTNVIIATTSVRDEKFADWQKEKLGKHPSGIIGCGKIKNLFTDGPPFHYFDLTENMSIQKNTIEELCMIIKTDVLTFFNLCESIETIISNIHLPCFLPWTIIEYLVFTNQKDRIDEVLEIYSEKHLTLRQEIRHYTKLLEENTNENNFKDTYQNETKRIALQIAKSFMLMNQKT